MIEFQEWPKTARLFRDIVITEKIDGTNACIVVGENEFACQSRKRIITPSDDNAGFARWAYDYADLLADILGPGRHYGEWWGSGIQRGYGRTNGDKTFSLFNTAKWSTVRLHDYCPEGLDVVPVLYSGPFETDRVEDCLMYLFDNGSEAAPGYLNPEGVCVFHTAARTVFKATLEDDQAKSPAWQPDHLVGV